MKIYIVLFFVSRIGRTVLFKHCMFSKSEAATSLLYRSGSVDLQYAVFDWESHNLVGARNINNIQHANQMNAACLHFTSVGYRHRQRMNFKLKQKRKRTDWNTLNASAPSKPPSKEIV